MRGKERQGEEHFQVTIPKKFKIYAWARGKGKEQPLGSIFYATFENSNRTIAGCVDAEKICQHFGKKEKLGQ